MREKVLEWIKKEKIIAIVRGAEPKQCHAVAKALYEGGIRLMEITYDQKNPDGWQKTADAIGALANEYEGRMFVGAGTVTSVELVEMTAKAGGAFIISPDADVAVIEKTRELGLVSMPGAMTPSEIKVAYNAGADFVKLFPIGELGVGYMKAVRAPLSHIPMMAVGGVNEKNAKEFLNAGASGLGIGGNLAKKAWIEAGEYDKLTEAARTLVDIVKNAQ
ncbi:MAG: bifunctional 4-hydroxy-2-oxoglutarate aldolase/2-dehydro-3-deoxy-phosphogluconate aldolase [Oscillospiraceae bacterium]|nr:bifunctional 4-hydroxy-2-oxoglutarate aldolase/2-dehydro-3-deoxy-phosphogluconate aldolase [Oscillospiraceae bacterium]